MVMPIPSSTFSLIALLLAGVLATGVVAVRLMLKIWRHVHPPVAVDDEHRRQLLTLVATNTTEFAQRRNGRQP